MLLELLYFSLLIVKERHFQNASEKQGLNPSFQKHLQYHAIPLCQVRPFLLLSSVSCLLFPAAARHWRPLRDLNPYYRRERAMS